MVADRVTDGAGVLEGAVDILQRNIGSIAERSKAVHVNRRKGRGQIGISICGKTNRNVGIRVEIERGREVVDACKGSAQIDQQILREDVRITKGILLRVVFCRACISPIISATRDRLQIRRRVRIRACWQVRRSVGVDPVVVETTEEMVILVECVVDANVEGVAELRLVGADDIGVGADVGRRKQLQVSKSNRVGGRVCRGAVAERKQITRRQAVQAVDGVVLSQRGNLACVSGPAHLAQAFIVAEEEGLILDHWTGDAAAELVLAQLGLFAGCLEPIPAVELVVAEELVRRPVEFVGARLGNQVDDATGCAPRLRSIAGGLNRDLLNGIDRGLDADGADDALIVVDTVNHEVVQGIVLSVDGKSVGRAAVVRTSAAGQAVARSFIGSWNELNQLNEVAPVQRKVLNRLRRDR